MKVEIIVLNMGKELARIKGNREIDLTEDEAKRVICTEHFLEQLTGFRFHINCSQETLRGGEGW